MKFKTYFCILQWESIMWAIRIIYSIFQLLDFHKSIIKLILLRLFNNVFNCLKKCVVDPFTTIVSFFLQCTLSHLKTFNTLTTYHFFNCLIKCVIDTFCLLFLKILQQLHYYYYPPTYTYVVTDPHLYWHYTIIESFHSTHLDDFLANLLQSGLAQMR